MKLERIFLGSINDWSQKNPLSIMGPTGSGKTSAILEYAAKNSLNPLLISLDSVAAYKELNIGSSKPMGRDRENFCWQGIDLISVDNKITAAIMKQAVLESVQTTNLPIVFVGGTHFYERFIIEGAAPGGPSDDNFLEELQKIGTPKVLLQILNIDSRWKTYLHPNDEYRVLRYGDLVLRQGLTFEQLKMAEQPPLFPKVETLILNLEMAEQEELLSRRINDMFEAGWVEEVELLLKNYAADAPGLQTVGYFEIVEHLTKQQKSLKDLKMEVLVRHRQLAKQQRTWLRKFKK